MSTCDCGSEIDRKNAAGHYREQCWSCIKAEATLGDDTNPYRYLADQERAEGTLTTRVDDDGTQTTF